MLERVPGEDVQKIFAETEVSQRRMAPWRMTFRYNHPRKGLIWIEGDSTPMRHDDGDIVWHGYLQDVTERARAEGALAASEARARAVIEGAAEAIFTFDDRGVIKSANAASARIFGHPVEELVGGSVDRLMAEPFRGEHNSRVRDCAATGEECLCVGREIQGLRQHGALFPMSMTISQARCDGAPLFIGFAHDLTEQRQIEARVRHLNDERLASLESMAASLAHEVNQPLAAGATFLTVARKMLHAPRGNNSEPRGTDAAAIGRLLDKASGQMLRAGKIITRAREFSRRGEPDKTFQKMHQLIDCVARTMTQDEAQADFRLIERLDAEDDRVLVDRLQISQVLVNLIRNAVQATSAPGIREIVLATSREQDMIKISVIDAGSGLSEQARQNLFEPFFTTKSEGMGVGLSISRAIIEAHFGKIWTEPNPGGGAIFSFTLPLAGLEAT